MRRDLVALILVLCTIGVLFAVVRKSSTGQPPATTFSFGMTGATLGAISPAKPEADVSRMKMGPAPTTGTYTIVFTPGQNDVQYRAVREARTATGAITAADYRQFLDGLFKAGAQGRETLQTAWDGPAFIPTELAQAEPTVDMDMPATAERYQRPASSSNQPAAPQYRRPMVGGVSATPMQPAVDVIQSTYWYELEGNGHKERYALEPFTVDGRQVLAYLQTTIVFRTWNQLQ